MKRVSKIFTLSILLTSILFAGDKEVIEFEKNRISKNPKVELEDVKISMKKDLPGKNWTGYIMDIKAKVQGKQVDGKDILFSNGQYVALDLMDIKSGRSLKDLVTPSLTSKYYDESKLIAGNHNAKDKIVVFSDPLCPFCKEFLPSVIEFVNKNSDSIALYYYHFPLTRIHPAALTLSKLMHIASKENIKDLALETYKIDWEKYFTIKSTNEEKILDAFNKEFNTNIKLSELQSKEMDDMINLDIKMGEEVLVQGTPTIFVNGEKDVQKVKYLDLGNKK